jgi:hypothetical protein
MTPEEKYPDRVFPATTPVLKQIDQLHADIRRLRERIDQLEAPSDEQETAWEAERREAQDEANAKKDRDKKTAASRAAIDEARARAVSAIARQLPLALKQAKAGKIALLRLILRSTR